MFRKATFSLATVVGLSVCFALGTLNLYAQDEMPPEEGGGAPMVDLNNPPVPPVKPVPPKPLEFPIDWLEERKNLENMCDSVIDQQFSDARNVRQISDNPIVQQFREYFSEKRIISEWAMQRPVNIDWSYPIEDATEAKEELDTVLTRQLEREAEVKFPLLTPEQYKAEAEELYKVHKIREDVEVPMLHPARGVKPKLKGRLKAVYGNERIMLYPRVFINRDDMSDEVAATFFPKVHEMMVEKYVKNAKLKCDLERSNYVQVQRVKQLKERLLAAHYVPNHIDFPEQVTTRIFKIDQWISRRELVMKKQREIWEQNLVPGSIGDNLRKAFMQQQGFTFLTPEESVRLGAALRQDEENRHLGWVPTVHVVQMGLWLQALEKYKKDANEYPAKLEAYKAQKRAYDEAVKANGGVPSDDAE